MTFVCAIMGPISSAMSDAHPDFENFMDATVSWYRPATFDEAFDQLAGAPMMDFGSAIQAVKNGNSVYREAWEADAPDRHVRMQGVDRIVVSLVDGGVSTYVPDSSDMLAEDWRYYNGPSGAVTEGHEQAPPGGFATETHDAGTVPHDGRREVSPTEEVNPAPQVEDDGYITEHASPARELDDGRPDET